MFFIDTNIFIYAHDETDARKAQVARQLLIKLTNSKKGCVSTQVVQEFCNVALKKSITPLKVTDVKDIVRELLMPFVSHQPDGQFYLRTIETHQRYSLSFYDAAIVQAAMDLGCRAIYSEDMQADALYGKVRIINPFEE